ncbi:hypothetical protein HBI45_110230 [Parastagonospora nodorum]|nr:hypothetical protein HBI45_110230 [Parastagonospora nodorum]
MSGIDCDVLNDIRKSRRATKLEQEAEKANKMDNKPDKPDKLSAMQSIVNRITGKEPQRNSEIKLADIAFHHAGYDPKSFNTVIFRLKGSKHYDGGVMASLAHLFFYLLTDDDTSKLLFISRTRGGHPLDLRATTILWDSDLYLHCPNPDDPTDKFWQYPLLPSFAMWQVPRGRPTRWNDARKSMAKTQSNLKFSGLKTNADLDLITFCNDAVSNRDWKCILSGAYESKCERAYIVPLRLRNLWIAERMSKLFGDWSFTSGANTLLKAAIQSTAKRQRLNVPYDEATDMHHPMNGIYLRSDLAKAYDNGDFILIPGKECWIAHFFDPTHDLAKRFDHETATISHEISRSLLLVRPAMVAFRHAYEFLNQVQPKSAMKESKAAVPAQPPVENAAESPGLLL